MVMSMGALLYAEPGDIDTHCLERFEVIQALYEAAKSDEWGTRCFPDGSLKRDEVERQLQEKYNYLGELKGRAIKINFSGAVINVCAFNQCNGEGCAERAIAALRKRAQQNKQ